MPLPEPTTRSPGKLVLIYQSPGGQHLTGVRYLAGVTLPTGAEALADATSLANVVKACIPANTTITGYRITDPNGATIIEDTFATAIVGTAAGSDAAYNSKTITLTGKGTAVVSGNRTGQTRMAMYVSTAFTFAPGTKTLGIAAIPSLNALKNNLTASTRYWADFYGQKAIVRGLATIQFNAHAQRKLGS